MNKKIILLLSFSLLLVLMIIISDKNKHLNHENERLFNLNKDLSDKVVDIVSKEETKEETCEFTKTYRVVDLLKYTGATGTEKFALVDRYQEFKPEVIEYKNIELEKNKSYEITYSVNKNETKIINIKETSKEGMDQIQEECH